MAIASTWCAFHDELLGHGTLPLATMRRVLPGWVKPRT